MELMWLILEEIILFMEDKTIFDKDQVNFLTRPDTLMQFSLHASLKLVWYYKTLRDLNVT